MNEMEVLQSAISQRQRELHRAAEILARAAARNGRAASLIKALTVILGASVATQAVFERILPQSELGVTLTFSLIGFSIAALSGFEAAFRPERKAVELSQLAAQCQSNIWRIDSGWSKEVGTRYGHDQAEAARVLLDQQDAAISDIQSRASQNGVNITLHLRELYYGEPPAMA